MIIGLTDMMVSVGSSTPARHASSKKMNCSIGVRPWPPYSFGQPTPSQPSAPILRSAFMYSGPPPSVTAISASYSGVTMPRK